MKRLAFPRGGYPFPIDGASPACRRGLDCPSLHDKGVGRPVKLRILRPLISVVTLVSNVVSNVLKKKNNKQTDI